MCSVNGSTFTVDRLDRPCRGKGHILSNSTKWTHLGAVSATVGSLYKIFIRYLKEYF